MDVVSNAPQLFAIKKNGHSNDEGEQRDAVSDEINLGRNDFYASFDIRFLKITAEGIVSVVTPDTVQPAQAARVLRAVVPDTIQLFETG